jgi:hypothetical protein
MIRALAVLGLAVVTFTACDRPKSTPPAGGVAATNSPAQLGTRNPEPGTDPDVSTIHWLGKRRLAPDTNAAPVMAIWNLPESASLGVQTLDNLALAPWRLLKNDDATNGAPVGLLRPLLDDLVEVESYLEFHHPTNQPAAWSLAIKLPADRAALWQTNLAAVLESLYGTTAEPTAAGFSLNRQPAPIRFVRRTNDWTIISFGNPNSKIQNPKSTDWLSLNLDLAALNRAFGFGWSLPANCPRVQLAMSGDGQAVHTRGTFTFATPPAVELQPWNIPTNLIHDPLSGFTACRVAGPLLESLPFWSALDVGRAPNQFYVWAQAGMPFQTYYAAPLADASNRVQALQERLVAQTNPWLTTNGIGQFVSLTNAHGFGWTVPPLMQAFVTATSGADGTPWLFAGHVGQTVTNMPMPAELVSMLHGDSKLVWFDWEITQQRVEEWFYIAQLLRIALNQAQVPQPSQASLWLNAIMVRFGNCGTRVQRLDDFRFSFSRRSGFPFSAAELHLVIDWLESPRFPRGLYSQTAAPDNRLRASLIRMGQAAWDGNTLILTNAPAIPPP